MYGTSKKYVVRGITSWLDDASPNYWMFSEPRGGLFMGGGQIDAAFYQEIRMSLGESSRRFFGWPHVGDMIGAHLKKGQ